jgi:hypothetical protein
MATTALVTGAATGEQLHTGEGATIDAAASTDAGREAVATEHGERDTSVVCMSAIQCMPGVAAGGVARPSDRAAKRCGLVRGAAIPTGIPAVLAAVVLRDAAGLERTRLRALRGAEAALEVDRPRAAPAGNWARRLGD